ncbi:hypothetical protein ACN9MZ_26095 [Pseudoduganella sp. S-14]|uniref:hypothetical protein n=1 Tax=Pseudoduganella sp. S-14 TaxID=3404065 RepID=UPI003CEC909B
MTILGITLEQTQLLHLAIGAVLAIIGRLISTWTWSKFKKENFELTWDVTARQIVIETFPGMPFTLAALDQEPISNVYFVSLRFWNKGTRPLLAEHISKDAPIRIHFGDEVRVLGTRDRKCKQEIQLALNQVDDKVYEIGFDGLNADEWFEYGFFVTGDSRAPVEVTGRLFGQKRGLARTSRENDAPLSERIANFTAVAIFAGGLMAMVASAAIITTMYSWSTVASAFTPRFATELPWWLEAMFIWGLFVCLLIGGFSVQEMVNKRKHPGDYPDVTDYKPTESQNLLAFWTTAISGKRQVVSASIYDYGKIVTPVSAEETTEAK